METISRYVPRILLALYAVEFVILAINPFSRDVWWAENLPIFAIVVVLTGLYIRGIRFSNLAYILASVLIYWHTVGGHYTFERVPFDWVTNLFGWERNNFDRVGHFSVGFYAFLFVEYFLAQNVIVKKWVAYLAAFAVIGSVAALYEVIEWIYAAKEGGEAGAAFLGSQGDVWDAQKDMALDMGGALVALLIYKLRDTFARPKRVTALEG